MITRDIKLVRIWTQAASYFNGKFTMPLQNINGGSNYGGLYLFRINFNYKGFEVEIHTGVYEFTLKNDEYTGKEITITATKKSNSKIELSIWRKDFLDKIWPSRFRTGFQEFDKVIGIRADSKTESYLSIIFNNKDLRQMIMEDKYRVYNIQTIDDSMIVTRKSGIEISSHDQFVDEFKRFSILLDGVGDINFI
jgi:hypothetical protein